MKFRYVSQHVAEQMSHTGSECAMISITEPGGRANLRFDESALIRFQFDDHDPKNDSNLLMPGYIWDDQVLFSDDQAKKLINFVINMRNQGVEWMYVHCHAGISRSRAVVLALWEWANEGGWNDEPFNPLSEEWNTANRHVYRVLANQLYGKLGSQFAA